VYEDIYSSVCLLLLSHTHTRVCQMNQSLLFSSLLFSSLLFFSRVELHINLSEWEELMTSSPLGYIKTWTTCCTFVCARARVCVCVSWTDNLFTDEIRREETKLDLIIVQNLSWCCMREIKLLVCIFHFPYTILQWWSKRSTLGLKVN